MSAYHAKKQKIIYILERFPSPTEYFILNEILQFQNKGFEIHLLVLKRQIQHENLPELTQLKATIHYIPRFHFFFPIVPLLFSSFLLFRFHLSYILSPYSSFLKSLRYFGISLYFANKNIQCDHIHAHFAFIAVDIASYLSKLLKVNYSLTVHAQDIYTNQEKIKQHLPFTQFMITCTNYNKNYLIKLINNVFENKIYKVYHGIDLKKWPQLNSQKNNKNDVNILSIARLVEKKGLIYLIKAVEELILIGMKVHCCIVGEGSLQSSLEKYIYAKNLQNFIDITPFVPQHKLRIYYSQVDVFVLPCIISSNGDRDGLPNVIVEAMLSGIPVISTPVSAIPEVIQHKQTGILVKEMDEQAIVKGINLLINDHKLRQQIIKNARRLIEDKLDINISTNELLEIFNKHISQS